VFGAQQTARRRHPMTPRDRGFFLSPAWIVTGCPIVPQVFLPFVRDGFKPAGGKRARRNRHPIRGSILTAKSERTIALARFQFLAKWQFSLNPQGTPRR